MSKTSKTLERWAASLAWGFIWFTGGMIASWLSTCKSKPVDKKLDEAFSLRPPKHENYVELKTDEDKKDWQEFLKLQEEKKKNHVELPKSEPAR